LPVMHIMKEGGGDHGFFDHRKRGNVRHAGHRP
jgi:hypothetical protein